MRETTEKRQAEGTTNCIRVSVAIIALLSLAGCPPTSGPANGNGSTQNDNSATLNANTTSDVPVDPTPSNGSVESPSLAGVQIFPADNPWNQDISGFPLHPNSDAYLTSMGLDTGLHPDFGTVWQGAPIGIPYVVVGAGQPLVPVSFDYADESDPGPYPIPPDALIEGGADSDGDRHVLVVDADGRKLYELFDARPAGTGWTAGSGAIFDLTSNALRPAGWTSADAAGLPILPGLVRYDEVVEKRAINHALRFTVRRTQRAYIPPATHYASSSTDPNLPPMGLRVRLRADFDETGFSPNIQVILRAMKKYGLFVADNGSDWYISGAPDAAGTMTSCAPSQVHGRDFEVVYTGELVTD